MGTSETPPTLDDLPDPPSGKTGWPWTEQSGPLPETQPDGSPWPKISIVTPSYNQGQFIEETIRSVLLQRYPNLEYIVMDGGSDDETVEILERCEPWIDYWVSKPDEGQSDAINKGFQRASGTIYNWINSDDFLQPGALHVIGKLFALSNTVDWVTGGRVVRSVEYNTAEVQMQWRQQWPQYLLDFPDFPQDATFFSAETWREVGGLDSTLVYMMDVLFFHEMLRNTKKGVFSDAIFSCMNVHEGQKTKEKIGTKKDKEEVRVKRRMLDRVSRASFRRMLRTRFSPYIWNLWRTIVQPKASLEFRRANFDYEKGVWELVRF